MVRYRQEIGDMVKAPCIGIAQGLYEILLKGLLPGSPKWPK